MHAPERSDSCRGPLHMGPRLIRDLHPGASAHRAPPAASIHPWPRYIQPVCLVFFSFSLFRMRAHALVLWCCARLVERWVGFFGDKGEMSLRSQFSSGAVRSGEGFFVSFGIPRVLVKKAFYTDVDLAFFGRWIFCI